MAYALFKDGVQVSKAHSTRDACYIEAMEQKVINVGRRYLGLQEGYEIKEIKGDKDV